MPFSSVIRTLEQSPLTQELLLKLRQKRSLSLEGIPRLPKGLVASTLARTADNNLFVVCATLEEAGRWAAQLETMGWKTVYFYPTSEASPYEPFDPESETIWGQMQVLADLIYADRRSSKMAIIATERSLQPHLPPPEVFQQYCLVIKIGMTQESKTLDKKLARLGYERVPLVETEGQWSRRGDIVDIFPVSAELPLRLEWFGDELEKVREFDPATQRSLDESEELVLTPTSFAHIIADRLEKTAGDKIGNYLTSEELETLATGNLPEGMRRFLGVAFAQPASLLDYLPDNTLLAIDEVEQCRVHGDRWLEYTEEKWGEGETNLPKIHRSFNESLAIAELFSLLYLSEIAEENDGNALNLSSRPLPTTPHQFAKLAEILRGKREIYSGITLKNYSTWLISAQPSRSVSLLQEHDCPAQFVPNPRDYPAIEKLQNQKTAVGLKYSGLAELEGFILPTYRIVVVTDREFFGQHSLATAGYIRKRRRATSKKVDINKLRPGDYVVHKNHGIGKFLKLEFLLEREYLTIKYADGLLRVPADNLEVLSRYRHTGTRPPELDKMSGKAWDKKKNRVRKALKKLAVDLLKLYAQRAQLSAYAYPRDTPWQRELEDSFPYQPTPDQLKAVQDVKLDLESDRPMDRLVCGDVGFGKTEVAIRAIFKVITSGNKQVAVLHLLPISLNPGI